MTAHVGNCCFFFNDTATTEIYTLSLHDALPISGVTTEVCVQSTMCEANDRGYECLLVEDGTASYFPEFKQVTLAMVRAQGGIVANVTRSEEHTSELQSRPHTSYADFCLKKKNIYIYI